MPSIPIGFTLSKKFGQADKPQSWSLFASILDIGSLFSYRADANAVGESEFNISNMIKPGLQVQYNFPKSPFYVGVGLQGGPQRRQVNDKEVNINSLRYFLGFGVDVPLLVLYQKFEE